MIFIYLSKQNPNHETVHYPFHSLSRRKILNHEQGIFDVLKDREHGDQVEVLENEPEVLAPE